MRDLEKLSNRIYDLCVIGGGIHGACLAWDAALRGLSVALVEKSDFCSATSANSLKIIHGGLRYLQHGDLIRMRQSIGERTAMMRIAPHLVHPLPVLIPTYGHGMKGKELLRVALWVNDTVGFDRNRLMDSQKYIPAGRVLSAGRVKELVPGIQTSGLTGGAVFYDAQVFNSERLVMSFLRSAEAAGGDLANYAEATGFIRRGDAIEGVRVRDVFTGEDFSIRARTVANTSGPWIDTVLGYAGGTQRFTQGKFARAFNVVTPPLFKEYALGIHTDGVYRDSSALIQKGSRLLFVAPWRSHSIIGTAYEPYEGDPGALKVTAKDIEPFLDEINRAIPSASIKMKDVSFIHSGLLPISGRDPKTGDVQLMNHPRVRDHREDGIRGLISVTGVKYTAARCVAEKVLDGIFRSWGKKPPRCLTRETRLFGGGMDSVDSYMAEAMKKRPSGAGEQTMRNLIFNYGSDHSNVLEYATSREAGSPASCDDRGVLAATVRYSVRKEGARKLADVIFRRTDLGSAGHPGMDNLKTCAAVMGADLDWSSDRVEREIREVEEVYSSFQ